MDSKEIQDTGRMDALFERIVGLIEEGRRRVVTNGYPIWGEKENQRLPNPNYGNAVAIIDAARQVFAASQSKGTGQQI